MLNKKETILYQKSVVIVKKTILLITLFISSLILASCNSFDLYYADKDQQDVSDVYQLINEISLEIMPANLTIYAQGYRSRLGLGLPDVSNQGSGFIFYDDGTYYYFLTSNHVVFLSEEYNYKKYKILDYKNNEYLGQYVFGDPNYDLAILKFTKTNELSVIEIAEENPQIDDLVFAIGQPKNQKNTITVGEIFGYGKPNCDECDPHKSNVNFECIYHNATIYHGSSGGMLINHQKQIVGINTFGSEKDERGIAVPASKITDFIEMAIKLNAIIIS